MLLKLKQKEAEREKRKKLADLQATSLRRLQAQLTQHQRTLNRLEAIRLEKMEQDEMLYEKLLKAWPSRPVSVVPDMIET